MYFFNVIVTCVSLSLMIPVVQSESGPCCKTLTQDHDLIVRTNSSLPDDCPINCFDKGVVILDSTMEYNPKHFKDRPTRSRVILKKEEAANVDCNVDCPELGFHNCAVPCNDEEKPTDEAGRVGDGGGWSLTSITIFAIGIVIIIIIALIGLIAGMVFGLKGKGCFRCRCRQDVNHANNDNEANELELQKLQNKEQMEQIV